MNFSQHRYKLLAAALLALPHFGGSAGILGISAKTDLTNRFNGYFSSNSAAA